MQYIWFIGVLINLTSFQQFLKLDGILPHGKHAQKVVVMEHK